MSGTNPYNLPKHRPASPVTKLLIPVLTLLLVGAPGAALGQYASTGPEDIYRSDERRYGHLEYFGFYASAMGAWNFTQELAPFTNLTWIHIGGSGNVEADIERLMQRLREARAAGVQATLSIEPFLFENAQGEVRSEQEILDFLVELRARIEFENLIDTVALMYPKDEPFREFIRFREPSYWEQFISGEVYREIHENLVRVNRLVKQVFPDKPLGVILSGNEIFHRFFSIPENYDWVGFDCYADLFKACDDESFVDFYQRLLDYMQPEQRLIAVPETWAQNEFLNRADWPEVLLPRLWHHYEIALNEPRFVAFVPFIWSFESDNPVPGLGLDRFADLFDDGVNNTGSRFVEEVLLIGQEIKNGMPIVPNLDWAETEASPNRPEESYRGEIMSITPGGLVSAWAFSDALPHKNLRVSVEVRGLRNKLLYRTRPERTFIKDDGLGEPGFIGRRSPGLHGYRHQLPRSLLARHAGRSLQVRLVVYADGPEQDIGYIQEVPWRSGQKVGVATD